MNTKPPYSITSPSENHIEGLQKLWAEAFGDADDFIRLFFDTTHSPDRCLVAFLGDEVLGALYWFDCEYQGQKLAYLYGVATVKKYRGMGVCHSLMAEYHSHLSALGYAGGILVPENRILFSFYRKLGYEVCSYVREFTCVAEKGDIRLHPLTKEQYATLRRKLLPENGVIQEGENLAFLQTYAQFYVGFNCRDASQQAHFLDELMENCVTAGNMCPKSFFENPLSTANDDYDAVFLLATYREENTLHGIELLGNPAGAAYIVHELCCSKGIFRTPVTSRPTGNFHTQETFCSASTFHISGDNLPFAMYHPLGNDHIAPPLYFGIAFD